MTVFEFLEMGLDSRKQIQLWDIDAAAELFKGEIRDAMFGEYSNWKVYNWGLFDDTISLNISRW